VVIMNVPDFHTVGDNALSATLNWNYVKNPRPTILDYYVYYEEFHLKLYIPDYENTRQFSSSHIIGDFEGNTNQTLVIRFADASCLRVLDPEVDIFNPDVTDFTRNYMKYNNLDIIQADHYLQNGPLDRSIFRNELPRGWCYYFQKADLARQLKDWAGIDELGNIAFALNEQPNNVAEFLPFIEGYAHLGKWDRAIQLSEKIIEISSEYSRMNCALWKRINDSIQDTPEKIEALEIISDLINCTFE
jgi:tetratricopeptide (TPR) repeat protein